MKFRVPAEWFALNDLGYADDPEEHFNEMELPDFWEFVEFTNDNVTTFVHFNINGLPSQENENEIYDILEELNNWLYSEYYI